MLRFCKQFEDKASLFRIFLIVLKISANIYLRKIYFNSKCVNFNVLLYIIIILCTLMCCIKNTRRISKNSACYNIFIVIFGISKFDIFINSLFITCYRNNWKSVTLLIKIGRWQNFHSGKKLSIYYVPLSRWNVILSCLFIAFISKSSHSGFSNVYIWK
jgi:hypothetical protein